MNNGIYEQYVRPVETQMMRIVWRITGNEDDAKDAFQEAVTVVLKRLDRIVRHPNPQALILRICIDEARGVRRRRRRISNREISGYSMCEGLRNSSASNVLANEEIEREIVQAVSDLPQAESTAVILRLLENEPYSRIAEIMNCREGTVRKYVARGRARLEKKLSHLFNPAPKETVA